ncbi:hypothetical protein BOTBODRAFT_170108 [Botryobasidium botryosum FD-172 SS1]|uniref:Uncharacterized protein n=1 Tax=Botryobasidium botryosum (strain FD-172 SS1) TaxID=930990 RepID=A0A067N8H9_BOTB1|nr:hypothetical protein BOTBODRAFT_170108 [Botryobasidium botryosum FD-172 SS1]
MPKEVYIFGASESGATQVGRPSAAVESPTTTKDKKSITTEDEESVAKGKAKNKSTRQKGRKQTKKALGKAPSKPLFREDPVVTSSDEEPVAEGKPGGEENDGNLRNSTTTPGATLAPSPKPMTPPLPAFEESLSPAGIDQAASHLPHTTTPPVATYIPPPPSPILISSSDEDDGLLEPKDLVNSLWPNTTSSSKSAYGQTTYSNTHNSRRSYKSSRVDYKSVFDVGDLDDDEALNPYKRQRLGD